MPETENREAIHPRSLRGIIQHKLFSRPGHAGRWPTIVP